MWTQILEHKNNEQTGKMRIQIGDKLESVSKELRSNKSVSTTTNPDRSESNETQNMQPSGSKSDTSIGVHASDNENSESENEHYLLRRKT